MRSNKLEIITVTKNRNLTLNRILRQNSTFYLSYNGGVTLRMFLYSTVRKNRKEKKFHHISISIKPTTGNDFT